MALQKNGDSSSLGTATPKNLKTGKMAPARHLSITPQTMDPPQDIHRDRWWSQHKADYFFFGVGFLPLACPILAWRVLRGALSFAFLVGFMGGVSSTIPIVLGHLSLLREGGLGPFCPPPPSPCLHYLNTCALQHIRMKGIHGFCLSILIPPPHTHTAIQVKIHCFTDVVCKRQSYIFSKWFFCPRFG